MSKSERSCEETSHQNRRLRLLFMAPHLARVSEVWLQRMLLGLGDDVTVAASLQPRRSQIPANARSLRLASLWTLPFAHAGIRVGHRGISPQRLRSALDSGEVNSVLCHFANFALRFEEVWSATDTPVFVHCHGFDITWDHRRGTRPTDVTFPSSYRKQIRELGNRVTFIVNSEFCRQRLLGVGIAEERICVKYFGVPIPEEEGLRALQKHDGDTKRPVTILFLGRLIDCKGPEKTIEAFGRAVQRGMNGRLIIAGGGPLYKLCRNAIRVSPASDRMTMLGPVSAARAAELMKSADIMTAHNCFGEFTRQEEAFGVTNIEGMAHGLPIVNGRSGGVPESVIDGETGILFEPGDVEAHAEALMRLTSRPEERQAMGQAARKRVREHFTIENEIERLRQIFSKEEPRQSFRKSTMP